MKHSERGSHCATGEVGLALNSLYKELKVQATAEETEGWGWGSTLGGIPAGDWEEPQAGVLRNKSVGYRQTCDTGGHLVPTDRAARHIYLGLALMKTS